MRGQRPGTVLRVADRDPPVPVGADRAHPHVTRPGHPQLPAPPHDVGVRKPQRPTLRLTHRPEPPFLRGTRLRSPRRGPGGVPCPSRGSRATRGRPGSPRACSHHGDGQRPRGVAAVPGHVRPTAGARAGGDRPHQVAMSGFTQDPVHPGATDRAGSLGHPAPIGFRDIPVEVTLVLAFHAIPVVTLGHCSLSFPHDRPTGCSRPRSTWEDRTRRCTAAR